MKRLLSVMSAAALMVAMLVVMAMPAFAAPGGAPNSDFGQGTSFGASNPQAGGVGLNPRERADLFFGGSVQDTQSVTRDQLRP